MIDMSIDRNLYLGYYIELTPITRDLIEINTRCEVCNKKLKTHFCSDDGGKAVQVEEKVEEIATIYEMLEEMGEEWEDIVRDTDQMGTHPHNMVYVFNNSEYFIDMDDYTVIPHSMLKRLPPMEEKEDKFVQAVKDMYGEDSIKVNYGLVYFLS